MVYSGFSDRILRVDLSSGRTEVESRGERFYRTYFGGRALIAHELLTKTKTGVDPLGPENLLIFAPGVITGAPIGGSGRNSVGARSPLTGCYGDAEAGGYWGAELKKAGLDAIIIAGKSDRPVYLYVRDDRVEVRDAAELSGKKTSEADEVIRQETGDRSTRICQSGPAGEKLVRFACVVNDLHHFAGRCGMGAVMGSKNLRAIAVSGSGKVVPKDTEVFSRVAEWLRKNHKKFTGSFHDLGTMSSVLPLNMSGGLPTRNFREGTFEGAEAISGEALKDSLLVARGSCFACPVRCKRVVEASGQWKVDRVYGGPEYETAAALGSNCGVDDLVAMSKANELCNAYGLDTISTGAAISFVMECFEEGIINTRDADGLELRFGNAEVMVKMVEKIAKREGIGDLLAEGVKRAALELGEDAEKLALEVKGQEIPMHEPRFKHGLGLGYALSPTGADHCHNIHDSLYSKESRYMKDMYSLGILGPLDVRDLGVEKVRLYKYESTFRNFQNCALLCSFLPYMHNDVVDIVRGVTGWDTSLWEIMKIGERAVNLTRVYNVREGFDGDDDSLPDRYFEAFGEGPLKGVSMDRGKFEEAKRSFYQMMGWSPQKGIPGRGVLDELGIGWSHRFIEEV
jgi:aldehyde:ferredoxin oxidoreductase